MPTFRIQGDTSRHLIGRGTHLYVDCRDVDVEMHFLPESLSADLTGEVTLLLVYELHMLVQHGLVGRQVVAVGGGALEGFVGAVHGLYVRFQVDLLAEGGPALQAGVRTVLHVAAAPAAAASGAGRAVIALTGAGCSHGGPDASASHVGLPSVAAASEIAHLVSGHALTMVNRPEMLY